MFIQTKRVDKMQKHLNFSKFAIYNVGNVTCYNGEAVTEHSEVTTYAVAYSQKQIQMQTSLLDSHSSVD